jgi:hypothetical protein
MIISNSLQTIFIHIHKCGGSSLEIALEPFLGWNDLILGSTEFGEVNDRFYRKRYGLHKHSTLADVYGVVGRQFADSFFKFALVRNPVARICSLYNFCGSIVNEILVDKEITPDQLREEYEFRKLEHVELEWYSTQCFINQTFDQFIRNEDLLRVDQALWPQSAFLMLDGSMIVDKFFRLEELDLALPEIEARLDVRLRVNHENKSTVKFIGQNDLGSDDIKYLRAIYESDFALLGY